MNNHVDYVTTFDASVLGIQVRRDVSRTRRGHGEQSRHRKLAVTSSRAFVLDERGDVGLAADVAVVLLDTAPATHPPVLRRRHHDDLVRCARHVQRFRQTVLHRVCRHRTQYNNGTSGQCLWCGHYDEVILNIDVKKRFLRF